MPVPQVDIEDIYEFGQAVQDIDVLHNRAFEDSAHKDKAELVEWISGVRTGCE